MNREEFFKLVSVGQPTHDLQKIQTAYWFSKNIHRPQMRDSGERYFEHPRRVAKLCYDFGYRHASYIVTALLHDILEDTWTPQHVIVDLFGRSIYLNLITLSKEFRVFNLVSGKEIIGAKLDKDKYYEGIMDSNDCTRVVKLCDRIDNVSDMENFSDERKAKYVKETEEYLLPIARKTNLQIQNKLEEIVRNLKK